MQDAKASVKAFSAELKANDAEAKVNGVSQQSLAQKAQLLKGQIDAQQKVIDNASQALAKMAEAGQQNTRAYDEMRAQLATAQAAMSGMQANLNAVGTEEGEVTTQTDEMAESLKSIDKGITFQNVLTGLKGVANVVSSIASAIKNVITGFVEAETEAAEWADELITTGIQYGLSNQELQQYEYAAKLIDAEVDSVLKARSRLLKEINSSTSGVFVLDEDSRLFDVQLYDEAGQLRDMNDIFWDTVEVLSTMENETKRDAAAYDLFGRSYAEVATLFQEGAREAWFTAMEDAPFVSEDGIERLGALNDSLDKLGSHWQVLKYETLASVAPGMQVVSDALTELTDSFVNFLHSERGVALLDTISASFTSFSEAVQSLDWDSIISRLMDEVIPGIESFFTDTLPGLGEQLRSALSDAESVMHELEVSLTYLSGYNQNGLFGNWDLSAEGKAERAAWKEGKEAYYEYIQAQKAKEAQQNALDESLNTNTADRTTGYFVYDTKTHQMVQQAESAVETVTESAAELGTAVPTQLAASIEEATPEVAAAMYSMAAAMVNAAMAGASAGGGNVSGTSYSASTFIENVILNSGIELNELAEAVNRAQQQSMSAYGA